MCHYNNKVSNLKFIVLLYCDNRFMFILKSINECIKYMTYTLIYMHDIQTCLISLATLIN